MRAYTIAAPILLLADRASAQGRSSPAWPTSHHDNANSGSTTALGPGPSGACLADVLPPGTLGAGVYFAEPGVTGAAQPSRWFAGSSDNQLFVGTIPESALGSWNARSLALADYWAGSPPPNYPATPFGVLTSPVAVPAGDGGDRVYVASGDGYVYALNVDVCLTGGMASAGCLAWPRPFGSTVAPPVGPQGFFTSPRHVSLVGGRNFLVVAETSALINAAGVWHVLDADTGAEAFNISDNLDAGSYGIFGTEPCIDSYGPHPDILFLMLGTNIVAYNITDGRFLDNGGAPTGGDPISSSCTCIVTQKSGAVFAQSSGPKELTLYRFNINAETPDGTERGGGFVSFYACSFTPGSSTCTRRSEPPELPSGERSAPGGFFQPTTLSERNELLALLRSAYERAHGTEQLRSVSDALAGQPALLAAALARTLPLETLNALSAPSGYRRLSHGRLGLAVPSGFIPTAVPTLTADDAEIVFPQHNPTAPFASKAQVPAGAIFYVDDGSHTVKWQMRGVGTYSDDLSIPFYSLANSASSVTIDAAGIAYAGADLNNQWRVPYPPYTPGDPQVNRTTFPVSGAPAEWSVPAVIAFNVSSGELLWAKTLRAPGAGLVADDSPAIMAPAGAAGPGILLITSPDPENGGVISIWAGTSCPSTDPLFDCSGHGDCDSCGGGSCSCDPTTCFTGFACADPVDCGPGGSCAPGVGGCVCDTCWLPDALGSCTIAQDCSGHGSCLPVDGSCNCDTGWTGPACASPIPSASPTALASASAAPAAGAAAAAGAGAAPGAVAAGILVPTLLVALGVAALKRAHPTLSLLDAAARTSATAQLRFAEALGAVTDSSGDRRRPLMTSSPVRNLAPAPAAAAATETASLLGPLHEARRARAASTSPK
jgi:hypothetical protein